MNKFCVKCDPNDNKEFCSSKIIINNLNKSLKLLDLYSEDNIIVYDCLGQSHGYDNKATIVVYETCFPKLIIDNCRNRPIFGVSRDNLRFILEGGYDHALCDWFPLGVNSEIWSFKEKKREKKIRILGIGESNSRGGLELIVEYFCQIFNKNNGVELYLRDRNASKEFKDWVKRMSADNNVDIVHDDRHLENFNEEKEIHQSSLFAVCLNKSSTWNLRTLECLSTGTPLVTMNYGGPKEYVIDGFNGRFVNFELVNINNYDLLKLNTIGLRNHLLPISMHPFTPYWCSPTFESFKNVILNLIENSQIDRLSHNARIFAEKFSWEKSAHSLSYLYNKFCK